MPTSAGDAHFSCHFDDPACFQRMEKVIHNNLVELNSDSRREILYLCVGTDRATGDCLGPLVGSRMKSLIPAASVYGTLQQPVHAVNLSHILEDINNHHREPLVIAIDASLGSVDRIGYINVRRGSLKPGTALSKDLPAVGDFHISGVVNVGGFFEHMVLQNTRLFVVYKMADIISKSLYLAHFHFQHRSVRNHTVQECRD